MALYVTGDVHGDGADLLARADAAGAGAGDEVLVLGDVGLAYGQRGGLPHVVPQMAQAVRGAPWTLVALRGNHDVRYERDLLHRRLGPMVGLGAVREIVWRGGPAFTCDDLPNAVFLPDAGGLYEIEGVPTLVAPGAYSIDKPERLERGWPWEPEEQLTGPEMDRLLALARRNRVECVLSHTCPASWRALLGPRLIGGKAAGDSTMERWMDRLLGAVGPGLRMWAFGHFHGDASAGFGRGRLMYREIADFGSLVAGSALGTAAVRGPVDRSVERLLGAAPACACGYTFAELERLTGCPEARARQVMEHQGLAVDPGTGEMLVMRGDVMQIVRAAWNRPR